MTILITIFFQLPRFNLGDWKAGTIGIPMFHCERCLKHWIRGSGLPLVCSEPEDITEGPAMCITYSDQTSSEMIVSGIVGKDGKPVRIKVKSPEAIKRLIKKTVKKEKKRRAGGKERSERGKAGSGMQGLAGHGSEWDSLSSDSSVEDLVDLPEPLKKYFLRKNKSHSQQNHEGGTSDRDGQYSNELSSSQSSTFISSGCNGEHIGPKDHSSKENHCLCGDHHHTRARKKKKHSKRRSQTKKQHSNVSRKTKPQGTSEEDMFSSHSEELSELDESATYTDISGLKRNYRKSKHSKRSKHTHRKSEDSKGFHLPQIPGTGNDSLANTTRRKSNKGPNHLETTSSERLPEIASTATPHGSVTSSTTGSGKQVRYHVTGNVASEAVGGKLASVDDLHLPDISHDPNSQYGANHHKIKVPNISTGNEMTRKRLHNFPMDEEQDEKGSGMGSGVDGQLTSGDNLHLPDISHDPNIQYGANRHKIKVPNVSTGNEMTQQRLPIDEEQDEKGSGMGLHSEVGPNPGKSGSGVSVSNTYSQRVPASFGSHAQQDASTGTSHPASLRPGGSTQHPSYSTTTDGSSTHSPVAAQKGSTGLKTKTATIREGVHLPVKQVDARSKQKKKTKKSLKKNIESPQIQSSDSDRKYPQGMHKLNNAVEFNPPAGEENYAMNQPTHAVDFKSPAGEENYAMRFGRNVVKKTKKPPEVRNSVKHNSKDFGNLAGGSSDEASGNRPSQSTSYSAERGGLLNDVSVDTNHRQKLSSVPKASTEASASGMMMMSAKTSFPTLMPVMGRNSNSSEFNDNNAVSHRLLSSGMGAKFASGSGAPSHKPSAPVRLKPLTGGMEELAADFTQNTVPPQKVPTPTQSITSSASKQSAGAGQRVTSLNSATNIDTDSGLEVTIDEDIDGSDDEETDTPMISLYVLKPISGLSFTSPFSFSLFPMAPQYRQAYNVVHKKAVETVRYGRGLNTNKVKRKRQ